MARVQLLEGKQEVARALDGVDAEIFGYRINRLGFGTVVGMGLLMLAGAAAIWWQVGLGAAVWTAAFIGLIAGGLFMGAQAAYWYAFAKSHFVATTDDNLYVGRLEKAWAIDWSVLDAEALGFDKLDANTIRGSMQLAIAGEQIKLHLYNAYIFLEDIQAFMFNLLKRLKRMEQQEQQEEQDNGDAPDRSGDAESTG